MYEPFVREDKTFLEINKWKKMNKKLRVGFTTRKDGYSKKTFESFNLGLHVNDDKHKVIKNRSHLADKLGFPLSNWVCGEQVHGTNVRVLDEADKGKGSTSYESSIKNVDGLITKMDGVLCTAFFADCVPLFFYDPVTEYVGVAHAGWKGTVHKIATNMIEHFLLHGSNREDILIVVGPSISQEQYEVNDEVIRYIDDHLLDKVVICLEKDRFLLDLKRLNVEILLQNGILRNNIEVTTYCSFNNSELFFSHRRDKGKTGRMLGYIGKMKE